MKTRYFMNWLLMIVLGVSASSLYAGEIVPFFDDADAVYSLTEAKDNVETNDIADNGNGFVTFTARFTLDAQSITDSATVAVMIMENGGTTNGNGIYLIDGQYQFLIKSNNLGGTLEQFDTDFSDGIVAVTLAPAVADVETEMYVCFSYDNLRVVSSVNGVGKITYLENSTGLNIDGNRTIGFLGTAPGVVASQATAGWLGGLTDDAAAAAYFKNTCLNATLAEGSSVLGQVFFMDIDPVWMPTVVAPADNEINIDPATVTEFAFAAPKDPADSVTDLPGITGYTVNVYEMFEGEPNYMAAPATYEVAGLTCPFSAFGDPFLELDDVVFWSVDAHTSTATVSSPVWKFSALPSVPNITIQPLADADVVGGTVEYTCTIISKNPLESAKWVKVGSEETDLTADSRYQVAGPTLVGADTYEYTLTVSGLVVADEGNYYSEISNSAGTSQSAQVALGVQREIAYWPLDEATAEGTYADLTGGHDAEPNSVPTAEFFVEGKIGNALNVAADPERAGITEAFAAAAYTDELTITAWINWVPTVGDTSLDGLVCSNTPTNNWFFEFNNNGNIISANAPGYNPFGSGGSADYYPSVESGLWVFVTFTSSAGEVGKLYINGEQVGMSDMYSIDQNESFVFIGGSGPNGNVVRDPFNGAIDEVRIFNYAFTNEEVAQAYYDVTELAACLDRDAESLVNDFNHDCKVDLFDFAAFTTGWLNCGLYPDTSCY